MSQKEALSKVGLTGQTLIDWLGEPVNSLRPELYNESLPDGLVFISVDRAANCIDFALKTDGRITRLYPGQLTEAQAGQGDLVGYLSPNLEEISHLGIALGSNRVRSQWGRGSVFEHGVDQVPSWYGDIKKYYNMPRIENGKIVD